METESKVPKQDLLTKLLKMTSSSNDGEALTAIRKANDLLKSAGWDWDKLMAGKIKVAADPFANLQQPQHHLGLSPRRGRNRNPNLRRHRDRSRHRHRRNLLSRSAIRPQMARPIISPAIVIAVDIRYQPSRASCSYLLVSTARRPEARR